MVKKEGVGDSRVGLAHDHIIGISRNHRVEALEIIQWVLVSSLVIAEPKRYPSVGVKRIKLCDGTLHDLRHPAVDGHTVAQRVGHLTVLHVDDGVQRFDPDSFAVMNDRVIDGQLESVNGRGIANDGIRRAVDVGILNHILVRFLIEMYSFPLPAHIVIGQVVEHIVQAVAAQNDIIIGRAIDQQF